MTLGPENKIKIVGLSGSLRHPDISATWKAVQTCLKGASEIGAQVRMLNLADYNLTYTDVTLPASEGVKRLRQDIQAAHGIILGTPEYHGSFSGVLKHALDLVGFEQFEGKIVGLVGVSGGKMGGLQALNSLRIICRSLHAWVVPEQVAVFQASQQFSADGKLLDETIGEGLMNVGRQVARFSYLHTSQKALEFLHLWETAPQNPGGYTT